MLWLRRDGVKENRRRHLQEQEYLGSGHLKEQENICGLSFGEQSASFCAQIA